MEKFTQNVLVMNYNFYLFFVRNLPLFGMNLLIQNYYFKRFSKMLPNEDLTLTNHNKIWHNYKIR